MRAGHDRGGWMFGGGVMMPLGRLVPIAMAIAPAVHVGRRLAAAGSERAALDILQGRRSRNAHSARPLGSEQ